MKMRLVSLVLVLVMLTIAFAGCSTTSEAASPNPFEDRFERYYAGDSLYVFVDKGTGVCYLWRAIGNKGGLTVMLGEDGQPVTYWEEGKP